MKVTVVRLRKWGEKLDPQVVRQPYQGVIGDLMIDTARSLRTGKGSTYALLLCGFDGLLPPLREITRIKVREGNILLVGVEEAEARYHRGFAEYRQAWWIRPLVTPPAQTRPADVSND
ncbi:MAG: hypothetical protein EOP38_25140 [Rubrivivax sp.]|nr:MAG: hypothetical protein EOP38_25140 [Rubrivivax sp.]